MFAVGRFLGRFARRASNAAGGNFAERRNFREERGDFTIALLLFSVVLITAATVAYTWPKSTSTRFTASHVATQALRAGIASVAADEAASSKGELPNRCRAREAAQSVIDDYRIHAVVMSISDAEDEDPYDAEEPVDCDNLGNSPTDFLPKCVRTGDDKAYLHITIDWYFTNPSSLVGDVTSSRASAQEDIPPALVSALCPAA